MTVNRLILLLAQGFGLGRIPVAPGTFGSFGGLCWFFLLTSLPVATLYFSGLAVGIGLSVVVTGQAERLLGRKDPSSVVLDEIVAVPVCFASWMVILDHAKGRWPATDSLWDVQRWAILVGIFAAFRVFDVLKPWPVWQIQSLPGGWGITLDDLFAAFYVNGCVWVVYLVNPVWFQ